MQLEARTQCELTGIDDTWEVDDLDCQAELEAAIEQVREDHDHAELIETGSIWVLKVHWNENTDSVWVGAHGYRVGLEVTTADEGGGA